MLEKLFNLIPGFGPKDNHEVVGLHKHMKLTKEQMQVLVDFYNTLPSVPSNVKEIFETMREEVYPPVTEESVVEEETEIEVTEETK